MDNKEFLKIAKDFIHIEGNIYHCERMFTSLSIYKWIKENVDKKAEPYYMSLLKRYMIGEILLYWEDGNIKIKK